MLTLQKIQAIVDQENFILRNLQITQSYHELSEGMKRVIGSQNANWCTFATHASKTAGYSIRHEVLPPSAAQLLTKLANYQDVVAGLNKYMEDPAERLDCASLGLLEDVLMRVSMNISLGNCKVFAELAAPFATMIEMFQDDTEPDESQMQIFLAQFRPGATERGGQDYLVEAFTNYYRARFEPHPKRKAEYIYLANVLVGLHEQMRLQPNIANALSAPITAVLDERLTEFTRHFFISLVPALQQRATRLVRRFFAALATDMLMVLTLPSGDLMLGEDVKPCTTSERRFPAHLQKIENGRLRLLLHRYDRVMDTLTGSGAKNWANLDDRMNFIVDLFRSYQQSPRLFEAPFSGTQQEQIWLDAIPAGKL